MSMQSVKRFDYCPLKRRGDPLRSRSFHRRVSIGLHLEPLEPRRLLAGVPIISEFMARNVGGLQDGDGRSPDWIEIYNAGDARLDLAGYRLTDDANDPSKWAFPSVNLAPAESVVVFASGRSSSDYVDRMGNLHTNFTLKRAGDYLALVAPNDTVVSEFGDAESSFPEQLENVSYGVAQSVTLVDAETDAHYLVPVDAKADEIWLEADFDTSAHGFSNGRPSLGLELRPNARTNFSGQFHVELPQDTHAVYTRMNFHLENSAELNSLNLRLKYDNGFVAYLNGKKVVEDNAPTELSWLSTALARSRHDRNALEFVNFDLSDHIDSLLDGNNILAVHGLNHSGDTGDMLLVAELTATSSNVEATIGTPARVGYMATPTPGAHNVANSEIFHGFVREMQFSVEHGFYASPQQVEILNDTSDADAYFTTDGSLPSPRNATATRYVEPLTVNATTTLRARAFRDGFLPSPVETQTYLFLDDVILQSSDGQAPSGWPSAPVNGQEFNYGMDPEIVNDPEYGPLIKEALLDVSTISIVTDPTHLFDPASGVFVNGVAARQANEQWERPTSVELIQPNGDDGFQIDAGIRMRGGFSRRSDNPKHAFRLMFRGEYGDSKLNYPLFGDEGVDTFDNIDLRTAQIPSWSLCWPDASDKTGGCQFNTMVREVFSRDTQGTMGQPYTRSRYHHLYLNGQYWGLFQSQERPEASFGESYLGGTKSDYDVIKVEAFPHRIEATDGNLDAWRQLWDEAKQGFATDEAYYRVQGLNAQGTRNPDYPVLLDVENLIDYMIVIFYTGDLDSPISNFLNNRNTNNWFGIRNRNGEKGFQFFAHDAEWTLIDVQENRLGPWPAGDEFDQSNPQWIHQQLMENAEYRLRFADRVQKHFFNGGVLTPEVALSRFQQRVDQIDLAIIAESARWGDTHRAKPYTKEDWLNAVRPITEEFIPERTEVVLEQLKHKAKLRDGTPASLYPDIAAPVFNQHGGTIMPGFELTIDATGDVFYTLDGSDPRKSEEPFSRKYDGPILLTNFTLVKARALVDGQWSALVEASFTLPPPPIRISEIMFHPAAPTEQEQAAGFVDDDDFEFVELINISDTTTVPMQGVAFTEGIQFTFPDISLPPSERIVVARNQTAFQQRYGVGIPVAGQYGESPNGDKLSNGGEPLRLEDASGSAIQEFLFDDQWYPQTDGGGFSLELVDSAVLDLETWNHRESWHPSITPGGTPGNPNGFRFQPGDANSDGQFDQLDIILVLQADKYLTGQPAEIEEGDWNGDGVFDQLDVVAALLTGNYLQGPYTIASYS